MEYKGKKYVSLKELSKDIQVPYSQLMHRYYRTGDIEDAVLWAAKSEEKKKSYILWNRQYENVNSIALAFGLNAGSIFARLKENESLEEIVKVLLQKETITFHGKEYNGISALATAYNHDPSIIFDRLKYGFELERALLQPIRKINRPEFEITYRGKVYASKNELYRELGIAGVCIHEMMTNHGTDFETAVDIYWETKVKAGIPAEEMLSYLPVCIIRGRYYKTVVELANEIGISTSALATYKYRHGCEGVIDTLQAMQLEIKEGYILNGKVKTYKELIQITVGGIGGGDIKLTGACGLVLGFERTLAGLLMALSFLLLFHAVRQCVRKIRKANCVAEKEQAYPLVPFLLLGMVISVLSLL